MWWYPNHHTQIYIPDGLGGFMDALSDPRAFLSAQVHLTKNSCQYFDERCLVNIATKVFCEHCHSDINIILTKTSSFSSQSPLTRTSAPSSWKLSGSRSLTLAPTSSRGCLRFDSSHYNNFWLFLKIIIEGLPKVCLITILRDFALNHQRRNTKVEPRPKNKRPPLIWWQNDKATSYEKISAPAHFCKIPSPAQFYLLLFFLRSCRQYLPTSPNPR